MYAQPRWHAGVLSALTFLLALMGSACTPSVQVPQRHAVPLPLSTPTSGVTGGRDQSLE